MDVADPVLVVGMEIVQPGLWPSVEFLDRPAPDRLVGRAGICQMTLVELEQPDNLADMLGDLSKRLSDFSSASCARLISVISWTTQLTAKTEPSSLLTG